MLFSFVDTHQNEWWRRTQRRRNEPCHVLDVYIVGRDTTEAAHSWRKCRNRWLRNGDRIWNHWRRQHFGKREREADDCCRIVLEMGADGVIYFIADCKHSVDNINSDKRWWQRTSLNFCSIDERLGVCWELEKQVTILTQKDVLNYDNYQLYA